MESYIDIHSHILPKIDDGAENFEMSMKMLETASENGVAEIILTPHNKPMHHNASLHTMEKLAGRLLEEAGRRGLDIRLHTGNEIYYRSDILEAIEEGKACTMAGSSYVLVEFGPLDGFGYIRNGLYHVLSGGYHPILAHAERYADISSSVERVSSLIEMGCYIQINAGSVMGEYGFGCRHFTRNLLKRKLVHFVATDAHTDTGKRAPRLAECGEFIARKYGRDSAARLLWENPASVIADKYI